MAIIWVLCCAVNPQEAFANLIRPILRLQAKNITPSTLYCAGYKDAIKTTILMKDINQFSQVNNIYGKFFKDHQPARAAFQVIFSYA
jgi:enamine deaminase RidA (YjgF/YER057c/UK114 family)